jgi:hypothetical protein
MSAMAPTACSISTIPARRTRHRRPHLEPHFRQELRRRIAIIAAWNGQDFMRSSTNGGAWRARIHLRAERRATSRAASGGCYHRRLARVARRRDP